MKTLIGVALVLGGFYALSGCSGPTSPTDAPAVVALTPANAAEGVDPSRPVVITFSRSMMEGMEPLIVVHEGSVTGPAVAGVASWSQERSMLTFTPSSPLVPRMTYVVHLSPALMGANGQPLNLGSCTRLGGEWVTGGMMGVGSGGMMNGQWGAGMMGVGWRSSDGTFGMFFTFTTA